MEKVQSEFYVLMDQTPSQEVDLILRTGADPVALSNAMREAVTAVDHEQPLRDGFTFTVTLKDDTHAEIRPAGAPPNMKPMQAEKVQ